LGCRVRDLEKGIGEGDWGNEEMLDMKKRFGEGGWVL